MSTSRIIPVENDGRISLGQHGSIRGFECTTLENGSVMLTPLVSALAMKERISRFDPVVERLPRMRRVGPGDWMIEGGAKQVHKFIANLGIAVHPGVVDHIKQLLSEPEKGRVVALYGPAPCIGVFTNDLYHRALNARKGRVRRAGKTG